MSIKQLNVMLLVLLMASVAVRAELYTGETSNRVKINLGETPWKFIHSDPPNLAAAQPTYNEGTARDVGIPYTWADTESFLNAASGGGDGDMEGGPFWYRKHFTLDNKYADKKIFVEFEGVHVGVQVYVNGTFMPGNSAFNPQATHVIGFVGFVLDITNQVHFGGTDNVIAARVTKSGGFYQDPGFSLVFRFGQGDAGIFRPVWLHITDKVHVPLNVYSCVNQWGTYVATQTVASDGSSATMDIKTNVQNEGAAAASVTLTTKIVNADNTVVWTGDATQSINAGAAYVFDQAATVNNPHLWYPNNSPYGTPYMHKVYHILKVNGVTVDVFRDDIGIHVITWDQNFPYFNGHKHSLFGASARYDYPALGTALPPEVEWRDARLLADIGGSLWRPGHSSCSPGFVEACDNEGVMLIQPSGEGEGAFNGTSTAATDYRGVLKSEIQRDVIIRDRNHPSILAWEISNGGMATAFAQSLQALAAQWDPINTHAIADRTPNPANGKLLSCTVAGCEIGVKHQYPNNPAWGAEYWSDYGRMARFEYDYELPFCADYMNDWVKSRAANCFGIAQWYMAETPGEDGISLPYKNAATYPKCRSFECSMMDFNRIPKLLYYGYQACWIPFATKPVVKLGNHWNRSGTVRVYGFSNCPQVRLLVNGTAVGTKAPNGIDGVAPNNDHSQTTTQLPCEFWWDNVTWASGTLLAQGLDGSGAVVCADTIKTAGTPDHIRLTVDPHIVKPNGEAFTFRANGTDAALILATVEDANNVWCPTATGLITWSVSSLGAYKGGTDQYVDATKNKFWHAPGDHELLIEGGKCKVAVRTTFTSGTVTVGATSPGLAAGSTTFTVGPISDPVTYMKPVPLERAPLIPGIKIGVSGKTIRYHLSAPATVAVEILGANGRVVQRIPAALETEGWHPITSAVPGRTTVAGVYFARFSFNGAGQVVKRILVSQ
jgi:beta-galactosidase